MPWRIVLIPSLMAVQWQCSHTVIVARLVEAVTVVVVAAPQSESLHPTIHTVSVTLVTLCSHCGHTTAKWQSVETAAMPSHCHTVTLSHSHIVTATFSDKLILLTGLQSEYNWRVHGPSDVPLLSQLDGEINRTNFGWHRHTETEESDDGERIYCWSWNWWTVH